MSLRIAVLTPDPDNHDYDSRWQEAFERYRSLFAARGAEVMAEPWSRMGDSAADVTLLELAWGYHHASQRFAAGLGAWPKDRRLVNPAPLALWNLRKTYLRDLAEQGVATIPTVFADDPSAADIAAAFAGWGVTEGVVKPQVSAGSHLTTRLSASALYDAALPRGAVMIQPFLPAVGAEGELSLFLFGGRLGHAVRKVAADGDFRVQPQYGGRLALFEPDAEARALALAAVAACPQSPAYARADMVRGLDGHLQLMELECIEPDLYLELAPDGGAAFVDAVLA